MKRAVSFFIVMAGLVMASDTVQLLLPRVRENVATRISSRDEALADLMR